MTCVYEQRSEYAFWILYLYTVESGRRALPLERPPIESPPPHSEKSKQTPGRLRCKNVAGGSARRPRLGLRPGPRWWPRPKPRSGGVLGAEPQRGSQHSCGEAAPGFGGEPQTPRPPYAPPPSGYATDSTCIIRKYEIE